MPKYFSFLTWLYLCALLINSASAQTGLTKHMNQEEKDPIEITSNRMRSEANGKKIIFSGNVISNWGDLKIISDILEIYNSKGQNEAEEIIAIGNVTIIRGQKKAKGDRAVYIDKSQKIIMTGSPKAIAWEGKNQIEGREMIFLLEKDRFVVNERVKMKIFPKKKSNKLRKNKPHHQRHSTEISSKQ